MTMQWPTASGERGRPARSGGSPPKKSARRPPAGSMDEASPGETWRTPRWASAVSRAPSTPSSSRSEPFRPRRRSTTWATHRAASGTGRPAGRTSAARRACCAAGRGAIFPQLCEPRTATRPFREVGTRSSAFVAPGASESLNLCSLCRRQPLGWRRRDKTAGGGPTSSPLVARAARRVVEQSTRKHASREPQREPSARTEHEQRLSLRQ